jgi:hypothetical protein
LHQRKAWIFDVAGEKGRCGRDGGRQQPLNVQYTLIRGVCEVEE